jgi:hypothetical protein
MSELRERLREAADAAARQGSMPGPAAAVRRGRQRRRRLVGGTVSLVVLALVAGTLGTGRLASRQPPLTPTPTTTPPTTSVVRVPKVVQRAVRLEVPIHLGPSGLPDRSGMASDLAREMQDCEGGTPQVRLWAQALGQTWVLAAREPLPGRDWICWSDGLWDRGGGAVFGAHGGSKDRLDPLQASELSQTIAGKGVLSVVGGPVTRKAVRLRILFRDRAPPIDLVPVDLGAQFPVKFYAVVYLQPAKTAWMPERVVAYDRAGGKLAECWAATRQGDVCD